MQHPGKWWIGLVPLLFVWIAANVLEDEHVERDIHERASAATPADLVEQAVSRVAGRDVALSGVGVSDQAGKALAAEVETLPGVRLVRSSFRTSPPAKPYVFSAKHEGDSIILSGDVPSKAMRDKIVGMAAAPGRRVVDHLAYASGEPANFGDLAAFGIGAAGKLNEGDFSTTDTRYRLSGSARSSADYEAMATAPPPPGSSAIDMRIEPAIAKPFIWQAARSGDTLTLSGDAPSLDARKAIDAKAASIFPKLKLADTMGVARGAPPGDFAGVADHALEALAKLEGGDVTIHDTQVEVSGTVHAADDRQAIDNDLHAAIAKPYALLLKLRAPNVSPYTFKVERGDGTVSLTGYAPDAAARQQIEAAAKAQFFDTSVRDDLKVAEGAPQGFTAAITGAMPALARLTKGSLTLVGGQADVSGEAPYPKAVDEVKAALAPAPGSAFTVKTDIAVAPPPPQLETSACQPKFADLLAKGHIEFETGSAVLSKTSTPLLDGLVAVAQRCRSANIEVNGYTDTVGAAEPNLDLSRRRAQSVVAYFTAAGLDTARITANGFGEDRPIAPNDTPEGRAKNRRIEFQVK